MTFALLRWLDDAGRARAVGIIRALEQRGLHVRAEGPGWSCVTRSEMVEHDGMLVVGETYPAMAVAGMGTAPPHDVARRFASTHWGRYVAMYDPGTGPWVLPDPSGAWPLSSVVAPGLTIVTDHVTPSLVRVAGIEPTINRAALAATLTDAACVTHLNYLSGIVPLTPGCSYDPAQGVTMPIQTIAGHARRPIKEPADALRATIDEVVTRLACKDMVLQLSGGLDSAVVLSSVIAAGHVPAVLNYATKASGGDERRYARLVAEHCAFHVPR